MKYRNQFNLIDGTIVEIKQVKVFQFKVLDVNTAASSAIKQFHLWKMSDSGTWIMDNAIEPPEWHRMIEPMTLSVQFMITAKLIDRDYTFWTLKWGNAL